ncbi:hypothetical protein D3C73_1110920 [compost metagenome]
MKTAGGLLSRCMAAVRVWVGWRRDSLRTRIRRFVQGRSPMPAPERFTTASAPSRTASSSSPLVGSHIRSRAVLAGRRTSRMTSLPSAANRSDRAVPIIPEAPDITILMTHLTMANACGGNDSGCRY